MRKNFKLEEDKRPRRYVRESNQYTVRPKTKEELEKIIKETIEEQGNNADLNFIDTSMINDMSELFFDYTNFNGDISKWDVFNVKDMRLVFAFSKFNGDISKWDVSSVKDMRCMFAESQFNGDISKWDVSNVENMEYMFAYSNFNGDISNWDVSNVKNMSSMFYGSSFNGDISNWDVSNVTNMFRIFDKSPLEEKYGINGEKLKLGITESYRRRY